MLITIYKCLNYESFAKYLKDMHMLTLRQSVYSSRRANILSLCKPAGAPNDRFRGNICVATRDCEFFPVLYFFMFCVA